MAATRDDWSAEPLPVARAAIGLDRTYTVPEFERIREGNVPLDMDDKWFVFYEHPCLHLHRSWTGFGIFMVRFEGVADGGARVAEVLVSRDPEQYTSTDGPADALLLAALLDGYAGRDTKAVWQQYMASRV
jgi:hypothetical protein